MDSATTRAADATSAWEAAAANTKWLAAVVFVGAVFALLASACGGGGETSDGDTEVSEAPEVTVTLAGDITVTGSASLQPIFSALRSQFNDAHPAVNIDVATPGTDSGLVELCTGTADIVGASRPLSESEAQECAANGVDVVELHIALNGIAVVTTVDNRGIDCVSLSDIYAMAGPESVGFDSWAAATSLSRSLGGAAELPGVPLQVFGPSPGSDIHDGFVAAVVEEQAAVRGQNPVLRSDYEPLASDAAVLQAVTASEAGFGWVGAGSVVDVRDVKLLEVDAGAGDCVEPTPEAVSSGTYALSQPLIAYVNTDRAADNAALRAFVDAWMADGLSDLVTDGGLVPLADAAASDVRSAWNSALPDLPDDDFAETAEPALDASDEGGGSDANADADGEDLSDDEPDLEGDSGSDEGTD